MNASQTTAEVLVRALQDAGHDVTLADLLDCLASARLTLEKSPREASQAYWEHLIESCERAA